MQIALGALSFGSTVGERDSFALLDRFVAAGGTLIDTANNYAYWIDGRTGDESEQTVGAWLAARGNRDQVFLSTKAGARPDASGEWEGLSAPVLAAAIEGSLRRLRTDHVDLYWAHVEDRSVPLEETLEALDALHRQGRAVRLGASNHPAWRVERARALATARGWLPYSHVQLRHSYLRPRPGAALQEAGHRQASDETLDFVRDAGLTLWAYSTLLSGAYRDKPLPEVYEHPGTTARLKVLAEVAAEVDATVNQVVLAWLGAQGIVPIVGVTKPEQLDEAMAATRLTLPEALLARLDEPA
ncbi:aldo/keto reductase [Nonomuraea sp. NPDC050328]|uniref:aldo/keto reductase n=1 Tax=Nonomuraea sp. NPDC050328 TaxID=3364361 RepID=UPI0037AFBB87